MNTLGHLKCRMCAFGAFTVAGLNTHIGKKHPNDYPHSAGNGTPDPDGGNAAGVVRVRDVEGAEACTGRAGGVQQPAGAAEQRADISEARSAEKLEAIWPGAQIFKRQE